MKDTHKAFLEAYDLHADALFRFCLFKISNAELAKDLVQDIYMKAWTYISNESNSVENMKALLYRTATNLIIDEYRRKARRQGKSESLEVLQEAGFEPSFDNTESVVNQIDGLGAIAKIQNLPPPYNETIFMRFVQSLEINEIAEITGESENTISVRIHRGLDKLRVMLKIEKQNA